MIRNAKQEEYPHIGRLMVRVYAALDGFPDPEDQPEYYSMLEHIGRITERPGAELLVAAEKEGIAGAVVYFGDMASYGSGGTATLEKNAAGFRLLAVDPAFRGRGLGRQLSLACIERARKAGLGQVVIHSTKSMQIAWKMYEKLGFSRSGDLDFMQGELPVYGFRLSL